MTANVFSPRFLALRHENNAEVAKLLRPMIEEGMTDGSIRQGNALHLAELFMLLLNFWTFPNIFPDSRDDIAGKVKMIKQIFDSLGFPILDEDFMGMFLHIADELEW